MPNALKTKSAGKRELDHLRLFAHDGGHVVEHHHKAGPNYDYGPPEVHVFADGDGGKLLAHISKHMGIPGAKEEAGEKEHKAAKKEAK